MDKVSKEKVDYRLGGAHCHACEFFIENDATAESGIGSCQKVAGDIGEHMLCDLFKRRDFMKSIERILAMLNVR